MASGDWRFSGEQMVGCLGGGERHVERVLGEKKQEGWSEASEVSERVTG